MSAEFPRFTKRATLEFLGRLNERLRKEGFQRPFRLYCTGGTKMVLSDLRESSVDVDFMLSAQDFRALSSYAAEIDREGHYRFDLFPAGEMPGYRFRGFAERAYPSSFQFSHLELYFVDDVDFVITKALAFRDRDVSDLEVFLSKRTIAKDEVIKRFEQVAFKPERERELRRNFEEFLKMFYGATGD